MLMVMVSLNAHNPLITSHSHHLVRNPTFIFPFDPLSSLSTLVVKPSAWHVCDISIMF